MNADSNIAWLAASNARRRDSAPLTLSIEALTPGADPRDASTLAARLLDALGIASTIVSCAGGANGAGLRFGTRVGGAAVMKWEVRALSGVRRAREARVDLEIIASEGSDQGLVATVLRSLLNGERVHLVRPMGNEASIVDAIAHAAARDHGSSPQVADLPATLVDLIARPEQFDLIIATPRDAEVLAAAAGALAGTQDLTPRLRADAELREVEIGSDGPSAVVRGLTALLASIGLGPAALRLHDAWLCALDDGRGHEGLDHMAPYAHRLSDQDFIRAVLDRLGRKPRGLSPSRFRDHLEGGVARGVPHLRLVP